MRRLEIGKKDLKTFFVGFLLGILVLGSGAGIFAQTFISNTKDNYSDEGSKVLALLNSSKEPALQKDYIITGLTLSDEFNEYLEEGVKKGIWTEEFLVQFASDYSIPILLKNYADVLNIVAQTDQAKELSEIINQLMGLIVKLKVQWQIYGPEIMNLINQLQNPNLKETALKKIKELIWNYLLDTGVLDIISTIANKLDIVKFKVHGTISSVKRFIKQVSSMINDPELKAAVIAKIKTLLLEKAEQLGLKAKVVDVLEQKIIDLKNSINLDKISLEIISGLKKYLEDHKSELIAGIVNTIKDSITISVADIQAIKDKIDQIISNLNELYEKMPEIKGEIAKIIQSFEKIKDVVSQINDVDFEQIVQSITSQIEIIKTQINLIITKLGTAEVVIKAIINELVQVDVEKDNWDFIVALKNWDSKFKLYDIPDSMYAKLNVYEPVINILTLDINYQFVADDGNIFNGDSSHLEIKQVTVGIENKTKKIDLLSEIKKFDGLVAKTINGILPVFTDNI